MVIRWARRIEEVQNKKNSLFTDSSLTGPLKLFNLIMSFGLWSPNL